MVSQKVSRHWAVTEAYPGGEALKCANYTGSVLGFQFFPAHPNDCGGGTLEPVQIPCMIVNVCTCSTWNGVGSEQAEAHSTARAVRVGPDSGFSRISSAISLQKVRAPILAISSGMLPLVTASACASKILGTTSLHDSGTER